MSRCQSLLKLMLESTVDYPHEMLSEYVWKSKDHTYTLHDGLNDSFIKTSQYLIGDHLTLKAVYVIGSITTNLYSDESDVDIDIILNEDLSEQEREEVINRITDFNTRGETYVGPHQVTYYLPEDPANAIAVSDGVYEVMTDTWIKGPLIYPMDYDPYRVYNHVLDDVQALAQKADIKLGELRRDIIDYLVIKDAVQKLPAQYQKELQERLRVKIDEINASVDDILKDKEEWRSLRGSYKDITPEAALDAYTVAKQWNDSNAIFKLLNRYNYVKIASALAPLFDDLKIDDTEVPKVKELMKLL